MSNLSRKTVDESRKTQDGIVTAQTLFDWIERSVKLAREVEALERQLAERDAENDRLRASMSDRQALRHETLEQALAENERLRAEKAEQQQAGFWGRAAARIVKKNKKLHAENATLRERLEAAEKDSQRLLRADKSWPLMSIVRQLDKASTHLLSAHDCDHDGYEELVVALEELSDWYDEYDAALSHPGGDSKLEADDAD